MKYNIRDKAVKDIHAARIISKNFIEFLDAACLGAVSGYSIYESLKHLNNLWYKALMFAGVVIALQALVLFVRHLNKSSE